MITAGAKESGQEDGKSQTEENEECQARSPDDIRQEAFLERAADPGDLSPSLISSRTRTNHRKETATGTSFQSCLWSGDPEVFCEETQIPTLLARKEGQKGRHARRQASH